MALVLEQLLSQCESLSSKPSTTNKTPKEQMLSLVLEVGKSEVEGFLSAAAPTVSFSGRGGKS
jgi:hypothetical protein